MLKNIVVVSESFVVGGGASEVAVKTVKLLASLNLYNVWFVASGNPPRLEDRIENVQYCVLSASRQSANKNLIKGFFYKLYNVQHVHNWPLFSYSLYSALIKWGAGMLSTCALKINQIEFLI